MKRVVLIDVFSPSNLGSYALLENSLKILKEFKELEIYILAYDPQGIRRLTGLPVYLELFPLPFGYSFCKKLIWLIKNTLWIVWTLVRLILNIDILKFNFSFSKLQSLKIIKNADLIISIGAERINDNLYKGTLFYLFQYWLITYLNKTLIFFPQTIGPFYFNITKFLTKIILKKASLIMVRDDFSYRNLQSLRINKNVEFIPDIALIQQSLNKIESLKFLKKEVYLEPDEEFLGISVLRWSYFKMRGSNFFQYKRILAQFCDWVIKNFNLKIICFSTNVPYFKGEQNDVKVGIEIKEMMEHKEQFFVLKNFYTPLQLKGMISLSKFFLATRMHACIFSTSSIVPTLCISYQPKCRDYMKLLELEKFCIDIDKLNLDVLKSLFLTLDKESSNVRVHLKEKISKFQSRIKRIPSLVERYLK